MSTCGQGHVENTFYIENINKRALSIVFILTLHFFINSGKQGSELLQSLVKTMVTLFLFADQVEVRVGNPFVLLQQSSSQLVSHLLLERQVPPDR